MLNRLIRELRADIGHVWHTPSVKDDFFWLVTEVGELGDALMRLKGFPDVAPTRHRPGVGTMANVQEEAADVLIMLTSLCDEMGFDLLDALQGKIDYLREKYKGLPPHGDGFIRGEGDMVYISDEDVLELIERGQSAEPPEPLQFQDR